MITLIIIVCIIVFIASMQKKKHITPKDMEARENFPPFSVTAPEMSSFSKIMNLASDKDSLLHYISYNNGLVEIRMKSGKGLVSKLEALHVDFSKPRISPIFYTVSSSAGKVSFYQTTNINDKQWDVINSLLCLAGSTRGDEIFGSTYKKIGYVNTALKAIKFFQ